MANYGGKDPREYCISTKRFVVEDGKLKGIDTIRVEWTKQGNAWKMEEVKGSEQVRLVSLRFPEEEEKKKKKEEGECG